MDFGAGAVHAIKHIFLQKLSASSQGEVVTVKEFSDFLDKEDIQ